MAEFLIPFDQLLAYRPAFLLGQIELNTLPNHITAVATAPIGGHVQGVYELPREPDHNPAISLQNGHLFPVPASL